jgi:hypothetical protein
MSEKNRIARDAAIACAFIIIHRIRYAFRDEDLESVFEDIRDSVDGAIQTAFASQDNKDDVITQSPQGKPL